MPLVMSYVASAVGSIRDDEAKGYLDNLLVGPVSRLNWLFGRISLVVASVVSILILVIGCFWLGVFNQNLGIKFSNVFQGSANIIAPVILLLGMVIFTFGVIPRLTTLVGYGAIAWSFLIQMIGSGLNLDHWLLDTSIFYHVALVPTQSINWGADALLIAIGVVLTLIGAIVFNNRDLVTE